MIAPAPDPAPAHAPAREVRAAIARATMPSELTPRRLGGIELRPHQLTAVDRLRGVIAQRGGALLADEVGLGKTFVALALCAEACHPLIIAPAALRPMWSDAMRRSGRRIELLSVERLSRPGASRLPEFAPDLVVVDEAHHLRNPSTIRYRAAEELTRGARVLLMTATPVHNRREELCALLAIFLGARAWSTSDADLARCIVRRDRTDVAVHLPAVAPTRWVAVGDDSARLEELLALPPPLPAADGGDGGALLQFSLLRQWASSQGALIAALERRLAHAASLGAALAAGRYPTRAELRTWGFADGAIQLAFPELLPAASERCDDLLRAVREHEAALGRLLASLRGGPDHDAVRAARLTKIAEHEGKVVAFSQFADTVSAIFARLHHRPGVAALSARGAVVAGGSIDRAETLRRFAPVGAGARAPHESERIELLLTTDLLSEGVNLQDASCVVHLDLPWTPARMEQRVGRVARLGSPHARVEVYAFTPPAAAESILGVERRLHAKLAAARRLIGVTGTILPSLTAAAVAAQPTPAEPPRPRADESLQRILQRWRSEGTTPSVAVPCVAAVESEDSGFLALVEIGGRRHLVASTGATPSDDPLIIAAVAAAAGGAECTATPQAIGEAVGMLDRWCEHRAAAAAASIELAASVRARRAVIARISRIVARAPLHARSELAPMAAAARQAAMIPAGAGAERILAELAAAPMDDRSWLRAVRTFGELHGRAEVHESGGAHRLLVLLLLQSREGQRRAGTVVAPSGRRPPTT